MLLNFVIPFSLICNMTMFYKSYFDLSTPSPGSKGGGGDWGRGDLRAKYLLPCCCNRDFKMHKIIFFSKKIKICVPTLPKMFRSVTRNTLIFYLAYVQYSVS